MKASHCVVTGIILLSAIVISPCVAQQVGEEIKTIEQLYPNLASGILTYASVNTLKEGVLLKASDIQITKSDIDAAIAKQPQQFQQELAQNAFFVLEQEATEKLLKKLAKERLSIQGRDADSMDANQTIKIFFEDLTKDVNVAASDVEIFYKENESIFCGTPLEKVRNQIESYVLQDKKQRFVDEYIKTVGQRIDIQVSGTWTNAQARLAKDNPLDKARTTGKPTLAVFSAKSCCGPDKMLPVMNTVQEKYGDKVNIVYIEPQQEQILSARYGIRAIPAQIFYDAAGKEFFRHNGFFSDKDIFAKLNDIGVR
jgi:thiol-disulfide isomerase/thioredoxin